MLHAAHFKHLNGAILSGHVALWISEIRCLEGAQGSTERLQARKRRGHGGRMSSPPRPARTAVPVFQAVS
jgi:hypothetical protein